MAETSIQWTDHSINPIRARNKATGAVGHFCEKISPGCGHCYSSAWNEHRFGTGLAFLPANRDKVELFLDEDKLHEVLRRRKPTKYFWCDMTDLFLDGHQDEWLDACFATMVLTPRHTHQVLTKRPERLLAYLRQVEAEKDMNRWACAAPVRSEGFFEGAAAEWPPPNVWLGVSVENKEQADRRVPLLLQCPAAVRFLSVEPLLGPVSLKALTGCTKPPGEDRCFPSGIHWVIVGGESGSGARLCNLEWVRTLVVECRAAGVAVFVKQLGARPQSDDDGDAGHSKEDGTRYALGNLLLRDRKGGDMAEWPQDLRVRQFPKPEGNRHD